MSGRFQKLSDEVRLLRTVFMSVQEAVFVVEPRTRRILDANAAALALVGWDRAELLRCPWSSVAAGLPHARCASVPGFEVWMVDAAPRARSGQPGRELVPRDALTGLPNREALLTRLAPLDVQGGEDAPPTALALLFIDLDDFKRINDTCGHLAGDRVLRVVAARIAQSIRPGDLAVRYGGDEFIVLVAGLRQRRGLERVARRIRAAVGRPIVHDGQEFRVAASVGMAQYGKHAPTSLALIAAADHDMYRAKPRCRPTAGVLESALTGGSVVGAPT